MWKLWELRQEIREHLVPKHPPMWCRVCGQKVFLYRRKLHKRLALALVKMAEWDRRKPGKYRNYKKVISKAGISEVSLMKHWGLVETWEAESGDWRITRRGHKFVEGRIRLPRAAWVYNDTCYDFTPEDTGIRAALGDQFDLAEMLYPWVGRFDSMP